MNSLNWILLSVMTAEAPRFSSCSYLRCCVLTRARGFELDSHTGIIWINLPLTLPNPFPPQTTLPCPPFAPQPAHSLTHYLTPESQTRVYRAGCDSGDNLVRKHPGGTAAEGVIERARRDCNLTQSTWGSLAVEKADKEWPPPTPTHPHPHPLVLLCLLRVTLWGERTK